MNAQPIKNIVIVGGGTSGWMSAAALSKVLGEDYRIQLVESDEIGIIGVGEATIPMIQLFNKTVGIDEAEFLRETQGTFKLGIEFVNWGKLGDRYMHGFGKVGRDLGTIKFEQYWFMANAMGHKSDLAEYSITRMAALANKFLPPQADAPNSPLSEIAYAYHFDASLYAKYLRKVCEERGVQRVEGKIVEVKQRQENGFVESVVLASGMEVSGDLFIDCSGFRGLLIEEALKTGYEDWTHWLPCDRAVAVPCKPASPLLPYTRSTAHRAGWQWRIPLQHRIGNGHVYSSAHVSDDEAIATLLTNLDGKPLADPRVIKFTTGMRKKAWNKNVVAVGLSGGFLEPLESTSIHLVQAAIAQLLDFFPDQSFNQREIDEYNRLSRFQFESIRNFIILHYHINQRSDSPFWQDCASMSVPESLKEKIALFENKGRTTRFDGELFSEVAWLQVMAGQNLMPQSYNPLAGIVGEAGALEYLASVRDVIARCVEVMPEHATYIARHCAAPKISL